MKKIIISLIIILIAGLMLIGCGPQDSPTDVESEEPEGEQQIEEDKPVTITFWHVWGGARLPMMEQQIADFQAKYPNITVEHTLLDQADMAEKYLTAITGGTPPDVIMVHGAKHLQQFATSGALMPLDDLINEAGLDTEEVFLGPDLVAQQVNGVQYALPAGTGGGMYIFHYDVDDFIEVGLDPEQPPTTWSELKEYAEDLTIINGDTIERVGFLPYGVENFPFKEWLFQNNGQLISDDGKTILFNSPEGVETLTWMVDFYDDLYGGFENVIDFQGELSASGANSKNTWYQGDSSMHVDGVWHYAQIKDNAPDKNVRASIMPYNDANPDAKPRNIVEAGWGYAIPVGVENVKEAYLWLEYATAGEGNLNFFVRDQGRPTAVKEYNEVEEFTNANPFWDAYVANIEASDSSPVTPVQAEINDIITRMTEEALRKVKTPEQALVDAAEECQMILDDYWATQ